MNAAEKISPPNTEGDPQGDEKHPPPKPHPAAFRSGILLMIASFFVYPGYGVIATLPLSPDDKLEAGVVAWAASWGSFALGSTLAGTEGVEFLRRLFRRRS